jgi:hypothetical protein
MHVSAADLNLDTIYDILRSARWLGEADVPAGYFQPAAPLRDCMNEDRAEYLDQLHLLTVLDTQFIAHIRGEQQDWEQILLDHLLLCQMEDYFRARNRR